MPVSYTTRDAEILSALTHRIRVLSLDQLGKTWWPNSSRRNEESAARLKILADEGFIIAYDSLAHPEIALAAPISEWCPGEPPPDFASVSHRLQTRWTKPFIPVTCFIASKKAGRVFGGYGGRRSRTSEQTHDIHLSSVFLLYRVQAPHLIDKWISEASILSEREQRNEKLPDAMIQYGSTRKVIEFGGSYGRDKIRAFHEYCDAENLPYEVW